MTKRPASRTSQLANRSPVTPVNGPVGDLEPSVDLEAVQVVEVPVKAASKPVEASKDADKPKKEGYYMRPSDKERAERARTTTAIHTGLRTWTAYVNEAVMAYTKDLEKQHNDSKPF